MLKFWVWPVPGPDVEDTTTHIAIAITKIIERHRTVGWQHDRDLQNRIRNAIDDFFLTRLRQAGRSGAGRCGISRRVIQMQDADPLADR